MNTNTSDRIKPDNKAISTYLDELLAQKFQIPTFQRKLVWKRENIKKLWDSIFKFYPLGSILIWKTDAKLQGHRKIGGHVISNEEHYGNEYQYILDGQQRTTSLLTSLYGSKTTDAENPDPTIFIDLTVENENEVDDESYKKRFLYSDEIFDEGGKFKRNKINKEKYDEGLIIKLLDVKGAFNALEGRLADSEAYKDYNNPVRTQLREAKNIFDNYRLSFIELTGIKVSEVCQIFERINQAGKPLDIFDIIVAKTYRPDSEPDRGFYLRDYIDEFRNSNGSAFLKISDLDYLQIIAILIRESEEDSDIKNITPIHLNKIQAKQIEDIWEDAKKAILNTFDFFSNTLEIKDRRLIPYRYLYMTIACYFYKNDKPDYDFLKKYFWFYSLHNDDLLENTTHLIVHIDFLKEQKKGEVVEFPHFIIDKETLRKSSYSSKGRLSRAILSLFASKQPKDFEFTDRKVLVDDIFFSTDKPNIHHIFPTNYIENNPGKNSLNEDSLINIAYLRNKTNLEISDKNPLLYIKDFADKGSNFEDVLKSHLIPPQLLEWSNLGCMPDNALDQFIEQRIDLIIKEIRNLLPDIEFEVRDPQEKSS